MTVLQILGRDCTNKFLSSGKENWCAKALQGKEFGWSENQLQLCYFTGSVYENELDRTVFSPKGATNFIGNFKQSLPYSGFLQRKILFAPFI